MFKRSGCYMQSQIDYGLEGFNSRWLYKNADSIYNTTKNVNVRFTLITVYSDDHQLELVNLLKHHLTLSIFRLCDMEGDKSIRNKVTIITGASSGIGAATAVHFSRLGAKVVLTGRNKERLENTLKMCEGENNLVIVADLTCDGDVIKIVEETVGHYGRIDILINNAGILVLGDAETSSIDDYDKVMATNLRSVFLLTTKAIPHLIVTKGNVVNVSSLAGLRSLKGVLAYGMTKAALDHFTRSIASDLAPKQVRVNSVNPGLIDTPIFGSSGMDPNQIEEAYSKAENFQVRVGRPEEVAKGIAFLASDAASFTTGACLPIDFGRHILCPH